MLNGLYTLVMPFRNSRAAAADHLLERVARDLSALAISTEHDFLRIGERLQEIVTRAQQQRNTITALADAAAADNGDGLAAAFTEIARWTDQTVRAGDRSYGSGDLVTVVNGVRDPLHSLNNSVRALRFLGVVTRIESARLGLRATGFESLANEVVSLSESMDEKSNAILQSVQAVCELLVRSGTIIADSANRQRNDLSAVTQECAAGLPQVQRQQQRLREIVRFTRERYDAFLTSIGNIVAALQSHDSARQGMEHVVETLREAVHKPRSRSSNISQVIELQVVQLTRIRSDFLTNIESILAELSRLGHTIEECARRAQEVQHAPDRSGAGWINELESRLNIIASAVSELAESRHTSALAAVEVQEACGRMSAFVAEIETVGERVLRLALNAEIQAVHLAGTGVVMEAVAEGIRSTAENASESAQAAGQALRKIEYAARDKNPATSGCWGAYGEEGGPKQLAARIRRLASELKSEDVKRMETLSSIAASAGDLCGEISELQQSITAGLVFDQGVGACLHALRGLASSVPTRNAKARMDTVVHAAGRYTMRAEREAHNDFVGAIDSGIASQPQHASEFGENVELF